MTEPERIICEYMADFFEEHFEKITYDLSDSNMPTTKKEFIHEIKNNPSDAIWSLDEICYWGMNKRYMSELYVNQENGNRDVIIIGDHCLKITYGKDYNPSIDFAVLKEKVVYYFE